MFKITEQVILKDKYQTQSESARGNKFSRYLKFYLIPGWRDPEFSAEEYQIEKIKSKRRLFRRLLRPLTLLGFIMVLFIVFLAMYTPWLTHYPLQELVFPYINPEGDPFAPPSEGHPFGTTVYGYDILARILWGARTTIATAFVPVTIAIGVGAILGTISAYFGGIVDYLMMRFVDLMYAFPTLILVIILIPILGRDLWISLGIFGVLFIPYNVRFMRSLVLQAKQLEFVQAAKTGGALKFKVMFKHIFPNAISPMIIAFFGGAAIAIIGLAGISFLGFGDPSQASWGSDILAANASKLVNPHASFWPGLFIGIAAIGFILVGDGLRDALDPRLTK